MQFDVAIVGGGIVGLATAYQIQKQNPKLNLILFEKEDELAFHQSGRNSGVIHSGLYYKTGSMRSKKLCLWKRSFDRIRKKKGKYSYDICW